MPALPPELQQRINQATEVLAEAERELATALQVLRRDERADKVMISETMEAAFARLSTAKTTLAALLTEQG